MLDYLKGLYHSTPTMSTFNLGEPARIEYSCLCDCIEFFNLDYIVETMDLFTRLHILFTYADHTGRYWMINTSHPLWKHHFGNELISKSGVVMGRASK